MPPDSGGRPARDSPASRSIVARSASSGSPPTGAPSGVAPSHADWPSRTVSAEGDPAPMNDQRDHDRPFSADSSKKVPGRLAPSFLYAESGVSLSASTFRVTGTTRCTAARALNSSRVVVAAPLTVLCMTPFSQTAPNRLGHVARGGCYGLSPRTPSASPLTAPGPRQRQRAHPPARRVLRPLCAAVRETARLQPTARCLSW
ncbi:Uncharacterised protein [Mycobacteroides abscessus subsp. abscessus]|nr:Uncharacterised protein [Mycobacteroides abscessus subsp. abscessus]SIB05988.1 Uncharacterised protein [Mycobacteroides abscessus subsp. abscessus]